MDPGIFAHLLLSSFRPPSDRRNPASTEEEVEMAVMMRRISGVDAEDQEVRFDGRKGVGQYLVGTVKNGTVL